jgi:hypothetical protein
MNALETVAIHIAAYNRAVDEELKWRTILVLAVLDAAPPLRILAAFKQLDPLYQPSKSSLRRLVANTRRRMGLPELPKKSERGGRPTEDIYQKYRFEHSARWIRENGGRPRPEQLVDPNWDLRPQRPAASQEPAAPHQPDANPKPRHRTTAAPVQPTPELDTEHLGQGSGTMDFIDFSKAPANERLPGSGVKATEYEIEIGKIFNRRADFLDDAHAAAKAGLPDPVVRNQTFHDLVTGLPKDDLNWYAFRRADLAVILLNDDHPGAGNWLRAIQKAKAAFHEAATSNSSL